MNDDQLNNLFAAARKAQPDTKRTQFAFETRLLARLRAERDPGIAWWFWTRRLAPLFAAIVLGLGAWNFVALNEASTDWQSVIAGNHDDNETVALFDGQ